MDERLTAALAEYHGRKDGSRKPVGWEDNANRFYLAQSERRGCCKGIYFPSRAHPYGQFRHGCSLRHVAQLFEVDEAELRTLNRQKGAK